MTGFVFAVLLAFAAAIAFLLGLTVMLIHAAAGHVVRHGFYGVRRRGR